MVGHVFQDRYQAVRLLGEGGMGQVYFARQLCPPREVVVKVMHERFASASRFRQTFAQEMALMARLRHPHIVEQLDAGVDPQRGPFLVLEFLSGSPLEHLRRRQRRFDPVRVGRWLVQLCSALHTAHSAGVVHRDIKPENVMVLDPDTSGERIKVMDFGLAQLSAAPHIALDKLIGTCRHIGGGTPDYLPPEQVRKDAVDHRGDIYSTGVMLFQLLTGRLPFPGKDVADVLMAHVATAPPRFAEVFPGHEVPPGVEAIVRQCLAKYPNERPQSARDLAERFEKALGETLIQPSDFPSAADASAASPSPAVFDPRGVIHHLEAWMPESIAVVKLRGFAEDAGGTVVESVPGKIVLRFRDPIAAPPLPPRGLRSWFRRSAPPEVVPLTTMELHMQKKPAERQNLLLVTVAIRPEGNTHRATDPDWQALVERRFRDLRAYLMGRG